MFLTIIGAIVLAVACIGVIMAFYRLRGRKMPKGVAPLTAGLAMIFFTIWIQYSWYSRTVADLPENITVIRTGTLSSAIQPWSLLWPPINRFLAIDARAVNTPSPDKAIKLTEVIIAERYTPTRVRQQLINCKTSQGSDVGSAIEYASSGEVTGANWYALEADDPLIKAAC